MNSQKMMLLLFAYVVRAKPEMSSGFANLKNFRVQASGPAAERPAAAVAGLHHT